MLFKNINFYLFLIIKNYFLFLGCQTYFSIFYFEGQKIIFEYNYKIKLKSSFTQTFTKLDSLIF